MLSIDNVIIEIGKRLTEKQAKISEKKLCMDGKRNDLLTNFLRLFQDG